MKRKSVQILVLSLIFVLILVVVWFQFRGDDSLQTRVIDDETIARNLSLKDRFGYYGFGIKAFSQPDSIESALQEIVPVDFQYMVSFGKEGTLDGLKASHYVSSLAADVQWTLEGTASSSVQIADDRAVRTSFIAPNEEGELKFVLKVKDGASYQAVANYVFEVVDPLVISADFNEDGQYDFVDFANLLQNWDSFGDDALVLLAVILSRYE